MGALRRTIPLVVTLLLVGLAACEEQASDVPGDAGGSADSTTTVTEPAETEAADDEEPAEEAPTGADLYDVSDLVDQVRPGVVAVTQSQVQLDYFGQPQDVPAGAGTGVVIDDEGGILTNNHVVAGAAEIFVTTSTGENLPARLVAAAPRRDLALLDVDPSEDLMPLPLGSSEELQVGDPVVAIGNALGLDAADLTVSAGIVSAKDRALPVQQGLLSGLIQTDAAINPGNSGGPLINEHGEVVGINTAVAGGAQNVGFAIAIDGVTQVLDRLRAGLGEPYLGVVVVDNSPAVAARLGLSTEDGAVIVQVEPESPAAAAGLQRFDVITELADTAVSGSEDVISATLNQDPGTVASVEFVRGEQRMSVNVTIGTFPTS